MDSVKMMNRIDTKYLLPFDLLLKVFHNITDQYYVLEIDDCRNFPYSTLYYDTTKNNMYLDHHNGKLNRIKIRFRKYIKSDYTFLEIKFKEKGTRTKKQRILVDEIQQKLNTETSEYIEKVTPYKGESLRPVLYTDFHRITLVNKDFTERVTIDHKLSFSRNGTRENLEKICIIETKRDGNARNSKLKEVLAYFGVNPTGMSKYCVGRALVCKDLKKNNFKERIIKINKIQNGKQYYRNLTT